MKTVFISMLGTQAFGALNPLLSLAESEPPERAFFLYNGRTRAAAERIKACAEKAGLGSIELIEADLFNPEAKNHAVPIVENIAREASANGERVVFNVNGGLNFVIVQCALALEPFKPIFLNVSTYRALVYDAETGETRAGNMPRPLPVEDVLDIQGISREQAPGSSRLMKECRDLKSPIPENSLENAAIGAQLFDLLWNPGNNTVSCLAEINDPGPPGNLDKAREICAWAVNREKSGDAFDREIYVVTNSARYYEHIRRESENKISVACRQIEKGGVYEKIGKWLARKVEAGESTAPKPPRKTRLEPLGDNTLVVCLGKQRESTLSPIASHKPDRLVLCYQFAKNSGLPRMARLVEESAKKTGVSRVDHVELGVDGGFCDLVLPEAVEGATVHVNITPGTKAQAVMLALWAQKRGHTIWSLNKEKKTCEPIYNPKGIEPIPLVAAPPLAGLTVMGKDFVEEGEEAAEAEQKNPFLGDMLDFMRQALEKGVDEKIFKNPLKLPAGELKYEAPHTWRFASQSGVRILNTMDGEWFERLVCVAFARAGADCSISRIRVAHESGDGGKVNRDGSAPFLQDFDVVAVMGPNTVMISCKSYIRPDREKMKAAALEAAQVAHNFGRMALPSLAYLSWPEHEIFEGVLVIGRNELCRPDVLRRLVEDFARSKQTSAATGEEQSRET